MARYHAAFTTRAALTATALIDIRTTASDRVRVLEVGIFNTAATAVICSVERQTTLGTTSATVIPQAGEPGDAAATALVGTGMVGRARVHCGAAAVVSSSAPRSPPASSGRSGSATLFSRSRRR